MNKKINFYNYNSKSIKYKKKMIIMREPYLK